MDAQLFEKNPDVLDDLVRSPGRVLAVDFYQVRTDPAYMHGWDTVDIRSG
jgi:hypothetical protein